MTESKYWIGIRRETKTDLERRAPLTPEAVQALLVEEDLGVCVEPSPSRVYEEAEYRVAGAEICSDLSRCNLIIGIKEIEPAAILPGKAYLFFSHTIKGQRYNMSMLASILERGATLIDYERVVDDRGQRLIFFGVQAGQAGMINTLWALGQRLAAQGIDTPFAALMQAREYQDLEQARAAVREVGKLLAEHGLGEGLEPLICGFAGYGNVSRGAQEIFEELGGGEIAPRELAQRVSAGDLDPRRPWKVVFHEEDMVRPREAGEVFLLDEYYQHPDRFEACFAEYLPYLGVLVNATYWDPRYPRWVRREDLQRLGAGGAQPRLRAIGDITCDPGGGFECTVKATLPDEPCYVYDPATGDHRDGFEGPGLVVMAVDILPTELPRESSRAFSAFLRPSIAEVARADFSASFEELNLPAVFKRAVIAHRGELAPQYRYLEEHLAEWRRG